MSKTVKLEDKVYHQLDQLRGKRETFSEVVLKLLAVKAGLDLTLNAWHGQVEGREVNQ